MNKILNILLTVCISLFSVMGACNPAENKQGDNIVERWKKIGANDRLIERPQVNDGKIKELLKDLNFSRGFYVTSFHSNTSGGVPIGALDHLGQKAEGDPLWRLAQWGCALNILDGETGRNGTIISYDDGSKILRFDATKTGSIALGIKGSLEYGKDEEGEYLDRVSPTQNWPHILIEQSLGGVLIGNCTRFMMEIEYTVTQFERLVKSDPDPNLHAAQYQWFITLTNSNPFSESYRETMWFGFNMFDSRYIDKCPPAFAAYDGGKEDSTGLFIYMFGLDTVDLEKTYNHVDKPTSVTDKRIKISVDILPFIKNGLTSAKRKGALKNVDWKDLTVGSTNIGWEIPGSYDVCVNIHSMNMYLVY